MCKDEGEPYGEECGGFEVERVQDVGDHEADDEDGDDGGAAEVKEEDGGGDKRDGDPIVVCEGGRVFEGSGGRGGDGGCDGVAMAAVK